MPTPDICENYHGGNLESVAANASVQGSKQPMRVRIYNWWNSHRPNGTICEDVEITFGLKHQTASARIAELKADGFLIETDQRRPTQSGRNARILVTDLQYPNLYDHHAAPTV